MGFRCAGRGAADVGAAGVLVICYLGIRRRVPGKACLAYGAVTYDSGSSSRPHAPGPTRKAGPVIQITPIWPHSGLPGRVPLPVGDHACHDVQPWVCHRTHGPPWCKGSTSDFGSDGPGSIPGGGAAEAAEQATSSTKVAAWRGWRQRARARRPAGVGETV